MSDASPVPPIRREPLSPGAWLAISAAVPLTALLVLPLAMLVARTPPAILAHYLGATATVQAVGLSVGTSTAALLVTLVFGTPLAHVLAHRRFPGRTVLEVLIDLPTVLPPAVAGVALLLTLGRNGIIGGWLARRGIQIAFTPLAVILAQTFVAAPYYIKAAAAGLASISPEVYDAAAVDAATGPQIFRLITLPLASRTLVGGAALCWSRALGEFGATIIFAGNYPGRTQTMPLAVYIGFEIDMNQALTLATIMLAISFILLLTIRATLPTTDPHGMSAGG